MIDDPQNLLQSFPAANRSAAFSDAFQCGKPITYFIKTGRCKVHCESGLCEQTCMQPQVVESDLQAEDCTAETVSIYSTRGHEMLATATDYRDSSNSIALTILKSISLFYDDIQKIKIVQVVYPVPKKIIEDGQLKIIFLTSVYVTLFPDLSKDESLSLQVHFDLNRKGLDQLMCISETDACTNNFNYFLKRKGLVNALP